MGERAVRMSSHDGAVRTASLPVAPVAFNSAGSRTERRANHDDRPAECYRKDRAQKTRVEETRADPGQGNELESDRCERDQQRSSELRDQKRNVCKIPPAKVPAPVIEPRR
jgi:hypothetical protein